MLDLAPAIFSRRSRVAPEVVFIYLRTSSAFTELEAVPSTTINFLRVWTYSSRTYSANNPVQGIVQSFQPNINISEMNGTYDIYSVYPSEGYSTFSFTEKFRKIYVNVVSFFRRHFHHVLKGVARPHLPHRIHMGRKSSPEWKPNRPNLLVTGTPGTGKTTLSQQLAAELGLRHIDVGEFARERNLLGEHDVALNFHYIDEDGVLDALEPIVTDGGVILDHHSSDWFPERWIQLVVVLRASTEALYDRLEARQYAKEKLDGNMQAEIMQVARDEARESYPNAVFLELDSSTDEAKDANVVQTKKAWSALVRGSDREEPVR